MMIRAFKIYKHDTAHYYMPKRFINISQSYNLSSEIAIKTLKGDAKESESKEKYISRSWSEFNQILEPERLYMYLDKAVIKESDNGKSELRRGHIAIFFTDKNSNIIDDSTMSLNPDQKRSIENKKLHYELNYTNRKGESRVYKNTSYIWPIRFNEIEEDIHKLFVHTYTSHEDAFSLAEKSAITPITRFLIDINLGALDIRTEKIIDRIAKVKKYYAEKWYLLADGSIINQAKLSNGGIVETNRIDNVNKMNCVDAVYASFGMESKKEKPGGNRKNPSPQMAAMSIMGHLQGNSFEGNPRLIEAEFMDPESGERTHDDILRPHPKFF